MLPWYGLIGRHNVAPAGGLTMQEKDESIFYMSSEINVKVLFELTGRSAGAGFFGHEIRQPRAWAHLLGKSDAREVDPYAAVCRIDTGVLYLARSFAMTREHLFAWGSSNEARHASDLAINTKNVPIARFILERSMRQFMENHKNENKKII